ncbi:hypothetical protein GC098_14025 [Paenibacillus sp. LMG 31458]|uniref:Uncharacterized protein n=1 Tax=Paenibacillus phytorum TaxID=2654977 RepID=A0ABX1XWV3_9BACL|nr:hypothetical protein [Paenibacillus phytorum]NOU72531.1 hypothetical protein [Paenibacillus phytorum]
MAKIVMKNKLQSRHQLTNPFSSETRHERLIKSGAVDIKDNMIIQDMGNGYATILPIDKNKRLK